MYAMCVSITGRPGLVNCLAPPPEMRVNGRTLEIHKIGYILNLTLTCCQENQSTAVFIAHNKNMQ